MFGQSNLRRSRAGAGQLGPILSQLRVFLGGVPDVEPQHLSAARAVSMRGELVVKTQESGASRRERLRTQAGRMVGEQTGLFVVPEIITFDDERGEIAFERLPLTSLHQALSDPDRSVEMAGRAADLLAAIHGRMQWSERDTRIHPGGMGISPQRERVPVHGDFGLTNVLSLAASDRLVVIDWSNAEWIGVDADLGAPEIDVAVFMISLFHRRLFDPWPIANRHKLARHFLTTYASVSPHGLDVPTLRAFVGAITPRFGQMTRRRKGTLRALAFRHGMIDLAYFLQGLSRNNLPD